MVDDVVDRQRPVPLKVFADAGKMPAHDRMADALLDRGAAPAPARDLAISVRRDQLAVGEHRLRLLRFALDDILNEQRIIEAMHGLDLRHALFQTLRHP